MWLATEVTPQLQAAFCLILDYVVVATDSRMLEAKARQDHLKVVIGLESRTPLLGAR